MMKDKTKQYRFFNDLPAKDKIYYQDDATVVYC